jgi:hypothetical protein
VRLGLLADDEQRIRHAIGDPCDPARRPTNVAISTLTLRHDRTTRETTCLLHWRDPNKVGHAGGLYQALPTGVFQAAGEAEGNVRNDFDLWRSMIRDTPKSCSARPRTTAPSGRRSTTPAGRSPRQ